MANPLTNLTQEIPSSSSVNNAISITITPIKTPILEILQNQTADSFLQQNYPAANQTLLVMIAHLFSNHLTKEALNEKITKLSNLHVDKQNIDKQLADLEENKTSLDKETIKNNYFNHLKQYFSAENPEEATILADIQEVQNHVIFENLFNKNKEIFSPEQQQLNEKYSSITKFNSRIFEKIEKTKKFTNLSEEEKFTYQRAIIKNFSQFNMQYTQYIKLQKQLEQNNGNLLSKEELQAKHDEIVSQIKQLDISMQPNLPPESAIAILQEITSKLNSAQESLQNLTKQQKQALNIFCRLQLFFHGKDALSHILNHSLLQPILNNLQIDYTKINDNSISTINRVVLSFVLPLSLYASVDQPIDFTNTAFRTQLINALNICGQTFNPNEHQDLTINLKFLTNDQILPSYIMYHTINEKILAYYHSCPKNIKILNFSDDQQYEKTQQDYQSFKKLLQLSKTASHTKQELFLKLLTDDIISQYSNLSSTIEQLNYILENIENFSNEKLEILAKFPQLFSILAQLDKINLRKSFVNLSEKKLQILQLQNFASIRQILLERNKNSYDLGKQFLELSDEKLAILAKFTNLNSILEILNLNNSQLLKQFLELPNETLQILVKFNQSDDNNLYDILFTLNQNTHFLLSMMQRNHNLQQQFLELPNEKLAILTKFNLAEILNKLNYVADQSRQRTLIETFLELSNEKLAILAKITDLAEILSSLQKHNLIDNLFALELNQLQSMADITNPADFVKSLQDKAINTQPNSIIIITSCNEQNLIHYKFSHSSLYY